MVAQNAPQCFVTRKLIVFWNYFHCCSSVIELKSFCENFVSCIIVAINDKVGGLCETSRIGFIATHKMNIMKGCHFCYHNLIQLVCLVYFSVQVFSADKQYQTLRNAYFPINFAIFKTQHHYVFLQRVLKFILREEVLIGCDTKFCYGETRLSHTHAHAHTHTIY